MYNGRKVTAIIAAAGMSERMGGHDKLFASLGRRPVLYWSIVAFENNSAIDEIVIVSSSFNLEKISKLIKKYGFSKIKAVKPGGNRRQDSVKAGLAAAAGCYWVLIHDGARPLVNSALITGVLEKAVISGAAIPGLQISDTVKSVQHGRIIKTLPRQGLYTIQTPQAFNYNLLSKAYQGDMPDVTDDAQLLEKTGGIVSLIPGSYDNIKITTPQDLELARILFYKRGG